MRKFLLMMFSALFLLSCVHSRDTRNGSELRDVRDSAYKIKVTLTLDLTPLNEWRAKKAEEKKRREEERKKEKKKASKRKKDDKKSKSIEFLTLFSRPFTYINETPIALNSAQEATEFFVMGTTRDTAKIGWTGTGWVAAKRPGGSFVMTAGHVCESNDVYKIITFDIDWDAGTFDVEEIDLPITDRHHAMLSRDGIESENSSIVRDEDLDEDFDGNDLCMLAVGSDLGPVIPVAEKDPEYGQTCSVVGAPTGLWGGGIAVASEAIFSGRGSVFGTEPDGLAFNGLLAPGNSGSAVVCNGQAVGVISLGSTRFRSLTHAVPHDSIRKFIESALHKGR